MNTGNSAKTLLAALLAAFCAPAGAEPAFRELLAATPGIYAQDLPQFSFQAPEAVPALSLAGLRRSQDTNLEPRLQDSSRVNYDAEKARRLAAAAAERLGYGLKGKCYNWVWKHLMAAGFPYEASVPDPSAYQFADWARQDEARAARFGLKIIPTPDSFEEIPLGSIVVYAPQQQHAYGTAHPEHGHIEIITDQGGVRYGCSDGCWEVGGRGGFLETAGAKRGVTVLIPIN
ncbi:MAG: hypothetical protein NDI60_07570 [Elusimicrobiales bacterium]|nr:hypothetical protein [Elusimicrobiales bacterium]